MPSCERTWRAWKRVDLFVHVGIDELADARIDRVHKRLGEVLLHVDARLDGAEVGRSVGHRR